MRLERLQFRRQRIPVENRPRPLHYYKMDFVEQARIAMPRGQPRHRVGSNEPVHPFSPA